MARASGRAHARHIPEETVLYRVVQEHLETFLDHVKERAGRQLPRQVVGEFRRYLECGILAHGYGHVRCHTCGNEIFVAFSCKLRGLCPSCNARRMCETAANLTDHMLPDADLRQWVSSVPFELRVLLAAKPTLSAVGRIFVREVARWTSPAQLSTQHVGSSRQIVCTQPTEAGSSRAAAAL